MPTYGDWVQPADQSVACPVTQTTTMFYRRSASGASFTPATFWGYILNDSTAAFTARSDALEDAYDNLSGGQSGTWQYVASPQIMSSRLTFVQADIGPGPQIPPGSIPDGASVEYEAASGTYLSDFTYVVTYAATGSVTTYIANIAGDGYVGVDHPSGAPFQGWSYTSTSGTGGTRSFVRSADTMTFVQLSTHHLNGTTPPAGSAGYYLGRNASGTIVPISATASYRPPRYRFVYPDTLSGLWLTRQRQTATGNAGGWPLRQRSNGGMTGAWNLRQRQTGL